MNLDRIKNAYKSNINIETNRVLQDLVNKHVTTIQLLEQKSTQYYYNNLFNNGRTFDINSKILKYIENNKSLTLEVAYINHIGRKNSIPTDETSLTIVTFDGKQSLNIYHQYSKVVLRVCGLEKDPLLVIALTPEPLCTINLSDEEVSILSNSDNYRQFGHMLAKELYVDTNKLSKDLSENLYYKFKDIFNNLDILMYNDSNNSDSSIPEAYYKTTLYFKGNKYAEKTQISEWLLDSHKSSFLERVEVIIEDEKKKLLGKLSNVLNNDLLDDIIVEAIQNSKSIRNYLTLDFELAEDTTVTNDNTAIIKYLHFVLKDNKLYISIPYFYIKFENKKLYIPLSENELNPIDSITIPDNLNLNLVIPTIKSNTMYTNLYKHGLSLFDEHFIDEFETIIDEIFVNYGIKSGASISSDSPFMLQIEVESPKI